MTYWDRRSALRAMAVVAGAAATAPLLGGTAQAVPGDADALFKAGEFERAGRAYEELLRRDPTNLHAARRRGFVGLLGNKFPDAEKYLKMAIQLAPGDQDTHYFLADCYIRQDKYAQSVPHWQAIGEDSYAKWFAARRTRSTATSRGCRGCGWTRVRWWRPRSTADHRSASRSTPAPRV